MSTDFRDLKVGDAVRLTGPDWESTHNRGANLVVTVDHKVGAQAWHDTDRAVNSLTDSQGFMIGESYAIERVAPVTPAKSTVQGYTLSLYVSKTDAAEFPGETQELASITIAHTDLVHLLGQGQNILEVVADG